VTTWSLEAYAAFESWAKARNGIWERWDPDYLVLTIDSANGLPAEAVIIDTFDDELTITFGYWESHLDGTDEAAVREAKEYAEKWLSGEWSTAVYKKADGSWCGSKLIEGKDTPDWLADIEWIKYFEPSHVEIRRARRSEWLKFAIVGGVLVKS
jgi:hypothetical protein